ncbi:chemotaxis protein CheW [Lysobacter auxotrophicus]|uniref:Chemotaxis protein CheW n=1 Tax=Lysobacter auxotrophicus TaxID=2992573 RepID=A0ABN6UH50_9GAMM|nr:chemotaxis protein CheW [Lysobacter auxotrophicus]BDU15641.1 chemotaxis protein CheW [Lysobacter auxotrophicus]
MATDYAAQPSGAENDIRGVLIQVAGGRLLLPNATIAEVLSYAEPDAVAGAPDWLLGRIRWRGWQLPLIAFGRFSGLANERGGLGSKVLVLRALGGSSPVEGRRTPYFALLTQGFPRLVTVSRDTLMTVDDHNALPNGVQARVLLNEDAAFLPDLGAIEDQIGIALAQAQAA